MKKLKLDDKISIKLRNEINEHQDFVLKHSYKKGNAWNTICSIMDRIDDLIIYLNNYELHKNKKQRGAFDFFDFIMESSVLIECIDILSDMYNIEKNNTKTNFFKHKYINEKVKEDYLEQGIYDKKENDNQYFQYIRSLSSVHPTDTDRHKIYMNGTLEVSPYVIWNDGNLFLHDNGDLVIVAYTDEKEYKNISIYIEEIFEYITYKYNNINTIIDVISNYNKNEINKLKEKKIKTADEFNNYNDYINNLILECKERCPNLVSDLEEARDIIRITISNTNNNIKYLKYCNAIKYSIKYIHNCLQDMELSFTSEESRLFDEILMPKLRFENNNYYYALEKIEYLKENYGDSIYGKEMYHTMLPYFNKYVEITEEDFIYNLFNYELYVLSRVSLYLNSIECDSLINDLIPKTEEFR